MIKNNCHAVKEYYKLYLFKNKSIYLFSSFKIVLFLSTCPYLLWSSGHTMHGQYLLILNLYLLLELNISLHKDVSLMVIYYIVIQS